MVICTMKNHVFNIIKIFDDFIILLMLQVSLKIVNKIENTFLRFKTILMENKFEIIHIIII